MVGKRQRRNRRRKLLEEDSEEKLMERRAALQKMLTQVDNEERYNFTDASSGENSEPEINQRTRLGSPFPTARSLSPDSESCDEVNKSGHHGNWRNQPGHHSHWGNQPFYCLPVNKQHPSTSSGYSKAYDSSYLRETTEDPDLFKNLRRSKEKKLPAKPPEDDVWVPLTFLDSHQKYFGSVPVDPKSVSRPKIPDLRRQVIETQNPPEEMSEPDFEAKHEYKEIKIENKNKKWKERRIEPPRKLRRTSAESTSRSRSAISESDISRTLKQEPMFENSPEKARKRGIDSCRRYSAKPDSRSRSEISEPTKKEIKIENRTEKIKIENPMEKIKIENPTGKIKIENPTEKIKIENSTEKIKKRGTEEIKIENPSEDDEAEIDSSKKLRTSAKLNSALHSVIPKQEVWEPVKQEIKVENPSEEEVQTSSTEDFKPLGIIPTDLLFNACVSIAAEIPEEALMSLKNLKIPKLEMEIEESEVITIDDDDDDFENSGQISREREIENVEDKRVEDSVSVASNEKIFEAVVKSMIEEKLLEDVETKSKENSRASSEEKPENDENKKIDFREEIEKFSIKLRIIKNVEERMKEY